MHAPTPCQPKRASGNDGDDEQVGKLMPCTPWSSVAEIPLISSIRFRPCGFSRGGVCAFSFELCQKGTVRTFESRSRIGSGSVSARLSLDRVSPGSILFPYTRFGSPDNDTSAPCLLPCTGQPNGVDHIQSAELRSHDREARPTNTATTRQSRARRSVRSRMSDLFDDCGEGYVVEAAGGNVTPTTQPAPAPAVLAASSSFKGEPKAGPTLRRRASMKPNLDVEEFINLLHGSDPVKVELNRLENEVRGGNIVTLQNLEIKKINDEKKAALAAQFAAEATLRRVHAAQKDDDMPPIEAILAPLEAELKLARQEVDKFHLRLKVLEEGLRMSTSGTNRINVEGKNVSNGPSRRQSLGGADNIPKSANGFLSRRPSFQMRSSISSSTVLKHAKGASKSFDGGTRSLDRSKALLNGAGLLLNKSSDATRDNVSQNSWKENPDDKTSEFPNVDADDCVSGLLYDMLQKEVITLRKACHEKDQSLKDKDDAIEMRREVAAMEKEVAAMRVEKEQDNKSKRLGGSKGPASTSQLLPGRHYRPKVDQ
ncbi:hypothetical protein B296_00025350 [Ensete ventricosum]|uniref:Uncharacterized protein n=1 Tax=Ensete ventricosum TaxID=4639 RepID=A0A427AA25_ENSVE|nr:hypothetical protein B296_00025350 [Ensete ventricosum]